MNSDTRRILRQYDAHTSPELYQYYSQGRLWDRAASPAFLIPVIILALTVVFQFSSQPGRLSALPTFLWNCLVSIFPARLLYAIDNWLNPPLFPLPTLQTPRPTHEAKSEVLKRIIGMNKPGELMRSVSEAGRRSLSGLSGLGGLSSVALKMKTSADQPAGLGNYDNSCYQNSILQSLAALRTFPTYLSALSSGGTQDKTIDRTLDALRDLIDDLNNSSNNGSTLWTPGILKNMSTWQQQDAQEYFSKLLDNIDKELAKAAGALQKPLGFEQECTKDDASASQHSDDSGYQSIPCHPKVSLEPRMARNPLEGLIAQRVVCVDCGYCEGLSMIPFNCLTLSLVVNRREQDLYQILDNYTKVESIQGVECARCSLLKLKGLIKILIQKFKDDGKSDEDLFDISARLAVIEEALEEDTYDDATLKKCRLPKQKVSSTKTKQAVIARPPQSLVIHMNRSGFDEDTGRMFKNPTFIRFPRTLDLGPWCLGSAEIPAGQDDNETVDVSVEEQAGFSAHDEEQWRLDPRSSMVAGSQRPSRVSGPIYELRAVITHYGHHDNGHYICYRRHPVSSSFTKNAKTADQGENGATERPSQLDPENHAANVSGLAKKVLLPNESSAEENETVAGKSAVDGDELDVVEKPTMDETVVHEPDFASDQKHTTGEEEPASEELLANIEVEDDALLQDEESSQWWRLSDQNVTKADEATVLAQGGVFMLFYDCVDPTIILASEINDFMPAMESLQTPGLRQEHEANLYSAGLGPGVYSNLERARGGPAAGASIVDTSHHELLGLLADAGAQDYDVSKAISVPLPDDEDDLD
ncbi:hypothetical protein B0H63DRAFT_479177 [Podospora didyma]|uniref:ubiquitinyl hydrolase 1 n=1 Tax=Podospora didyma TaxID=330526 RepID=A0AAE0KL08_9PEZI|nr:hypothetical protein B0H63DRAFT_479177 [Podospora didyma]